MSKTAVHDPEANLEVHQLTDHELDVVSGGDACVTLGVFADRKYVLCFPTLPPPPPHK